MSKILETLTPGKTVQCTVTKLPAAVDDVNTIERLMRRDPANVKALRRAQRVRAQRLLIYNRGNRDWVSRENPARVVRVTKDAAWTMAFTYDALPDLKKVGKFLSIKAS